jgi:hypothetical protein
VPHERCPVLTRKDVLLAQAKGGVLSNDVVTPDWDNLESKERDVLTIMHTVLRGERTQAELGRLLDLNTPQCDVTNDETKPAMMPPSSMTCMADLPITSPIPSSDKPFSSPTANTTPASDPPGVAGHSQASLLGNIG